MADRFNVAAVRFRLTTYRTPIHCASIPPAGRPAKGQSIGGEMRNRKPVSYSESRRDFVRLGLGVAGGLALPAGFAREAFGQDKAPIGTWPAGSQGDSVF